MMQFLCKCTVRFCREMLESVGHVTCITIAVYSKKFSNFFLFLLFLEKETIERDPLLVNTERSPNHLFSSTHCQSLSLWANYIPSLSYTGIISHLLKRACGRAVLKILEVSHCKQ